MATDAGDREVLKNAGTCCTVATDHRSGKVGACRLLTACCNWQSTDWWGNSRLVEVKEKAFKSRVVNFLCGMAKEIKKVKMAEKNTKKKEDINVTKEPLARTEGEPRGDLKEQRRPKKRSGPRWGKTEAGTENKASQTKREEIRKVATMVKRLKRSTNESADDPKHGCKMEAGSTEAAG
jgi:hypothetical protein